VNRRLTQTLVLMAVMLVPAMAWASEGSDTSKFATIINDYGIAVAILASFGFGFVASLTPCVYPMVPITVSIFGATEAKSRFRGAALSGAFVLGIATLFTTMGVASALSGKLMGSALSNAYVVIGLSVLFLALAASMFGAFELALPSGLTNRLSTVGGVGFKGAFVMGLVMGLIAAPCTGPFVTGMVVYIAETKSVVLGSASFFSFSLGLGVLFFVAGSFAVSLPKGGAWMMGIKWVSGVGLAYMAFKYLRDRFDVIRDAVSNGSTVFGLVAFTLLVIGLVLGGIHVAAERRKSPIAHLSKPMKLASIIPAVAGLALVLTWIDQPHGGEAGDVADITWIDDEEEGRAKALAEGKPVLVDFGATWCAACKELEHKTFPDAMVKSEAARFVAIRVDASDDEDEDTVRLQKKYNVVGLPTVVMLDKDGNEVVRFTEFVPPERFVEALKKVPPGTAPTTVGMK
jgi:thioredoxin:protein disulfide reductase